MRFETWVIYHSRKPDRQANRAMGKNPSEMRSGYRGLEVPIISFFGDDNSPLEQLTTVMLHRRFHRVTILSRRNLEARTGV